LHIELNATPHFTAGVIVPPHGPSPTIKFAETAKPPNSSLELPQAGYDRS